MNPWDKFKSAINDVAFDLFFQKEVIWFRLKKRLDFHGESEADISYEQVPIKALVENNIYRLRPIDKFTNTGQIDSQFCWLILNKAYLQRNGWLNNDGYFSFNAGRDYFLIDGIRYHDAGDTLASQTDSDNVLFYILLKREEHKTGEKVH